MSRYVTINEDQPTCGAVFEIDGHNIMSDGELVRHIEGVTLVCSRPEGHTPANRHSDGVTDWIGDEEE